MLSSPFLLLPVASFKVPVKDNTQLLLHSSPLSKIRGLFSSKSLPDLTEALKALQSYQCK